ncbi:MAG: TSUP family transporter [Acidimicrobiia bacterium]
MAHPVAGHRRYQLRLGLVGLVAGLLSGLLGVGGGVVMVPLLVGLLGFDQHRAHATSLAAIVIIAISAAVAFGASGEVDLEVAGGLILGGLVGSYIGASFMARIPADTLKLVFSLIIIVAGLGMVLG